MNFRLSFFLFIFLLAAVLPGVLFAAGISVDPFAPFDYDPAVYNDCNYCHKLHNARSDLSAMLNEREERYGRYVGGNFLSTNEEQSVFGEETPRKCPRSRAKSRR